MSPSKRPELITYRQAGNQAAVIFIHGFTGGSDTTFASLAEFLRDRKDMADWDLFSLGYPTHLSMDVRGIWSGDPDLGLLSKYLTSRVKLSPLTGYRVVALVAHSMGGLIVQRALLDDAALVKRTSHVLLFGTPSGGLRKASPFWWFKPQMRDMGRGGRFITDLRARWTATGWNRTVQSGNPFSLWVIPGLQDQFVPIVSSAKPFPRSLWHPIHGNHVQIVNPASADSEPVMTVVGALGGTTGVTGTLNSARVAVETGKFQDVIDHYLPRASQLTQLDLVDLTLALDAMNRRPEAIALLKAAGRSTDARGVLAGRYKREWWVDRRRADGERAIELYSAAYTDSLGRDDHDQAYYHGINLAFLALTFEGDRSKSKALATDVLAHCEQAEPGLWRSAAIAEAKLYLGNPDEAIGFYREALAQNPTPREAVSMFQQASWVADKQRDERTVDRLAEIFHHAAPATST